MGNAATYDFLSILCDSEQFFFWWGQFLSQVENPLVVAPVIWRRKDQDIYRDIYSEQWVLLNPEV